MVSVRRRLVAYKAVVIMVLGSFLMSCNCSRQSLRGEAAAKFEHVTKDVGLLGDRHNPALGYKKHDDVEKNGDGGVKMTGTSELRLSSKRRLVSSQKSMMSHEKKIISGTEAAESLESAGSILDETEIMQEPAQKHRRTLLKSSMDTNKKKKRIFTNSSDENSPRPVAEETSASNSTTLFKQERNQDLGGGIMEMDYSPARRRGPIHNKLISP